MRTDVKSMRDVFIEQIYARMHSDKKIFFLCADFGSPKLDPLRKKFRDRFINVGIAEQNLVNVSTGLALEGFTVYAYAIASFLTMRAYEQIRTNLALYAQLKEINVNLIGVGAGLSYDISGPTHHCLEDISIMRTLPNVTIFSPSDSVLTEKFLDYSICVKKPKYLRFDGKPLPEIYRHIEGMKLENGFYELARGEKVCLVSTGYMTHKAIKVAKRLINDDIHIGLIDVFLLRPFDEDLFLKSLNKYKCVITLEEGFINKGGLDSLVSSIIDKKELNIRLKRMGFNDDYVFNIGSRDYLHGLCNLDEQNIIEKVKDISKKI